MKTLEIPKFNDLSKDDQQRAVLNFYEDKDVVATDYYIKYISSKDFEKVPLTQMFIWEDSREGFNYWYNIVYGKYRGI
jgi:hypothetical protein